MSQKATSGKKGSRPIAGISIIGLGNWGTSLAHALRSAGMPLREVIRISEPGRSRPSRRGRQEADQARNFPITTLDRSRLDAAVLWLCVPDSAIAQVTRLLIEHKRDQFKGRVFKGQIIVHSSGALSTGVLQPAARAGARVGSVHPLMTFPARTPVSLDRVPFAIEADQSARRRLNVIVRKLGGSPFAIAAQSKPLYHAVGMLTSPLLVSLIAAAEQAAALAGLTSRQARRLVEPITQTTLKNIFSRGAASSFSGPIARGDVAAIDLHLQALLAHPMLADVYRSLALYALEVLPAQNPGEIRSMLERTNRKHRTSAASVLPPQHEKLISPSFKRKSARL